MKVIYTMMAWLLGALVGGIVSYFFIFTYIYVIYAKANPLPPSEEDARGNVVAYLSILIGGILCGIFCAVYYARSYNKR